MRARILTSGDAWWDLTTTRYELPKDSDVHPVFCGSFSVSQNNNYPLYGFRIDKNNLECNAYTGDVNVFPNPFSDQTVIHFENTDEHEATVKLYDVQGKLVREINTTSDRVVISSAGLFSGMYVWTLELEGEKPRTGKVILR